MATTKRQDKIQATIERLNTHKQQFSIQHWLASSASEVNQSK